MSGGLLALTGHRPDKLGGYGSGTNAKVRSFARLVLEHEQPDGVLGGMAQGWDMQAMWAAVDLGIPVHAAVPFAGQERMWPLQAQRDYRELLSRCVTVTVIEKGGFTRQAMLNRNVWMMDRGHRIAALWDGSAGGTGHAVGYATKHGYELRNWWPEWQAGPDLHGADPECHHDEQPAPAGGVRCIKCGGWFCF